MFNTHKILGSVRSTLTAYVDSTSQYTELFKKNCAKHNAEERKQVKKAIPNVNTISI